MSTFSNNLKERGYTNLAVVFDGKQGLSYERVGLGCIVPRAPILMEIEGKLAYPAIKRKGYGSSYIVNFDGKEIQQSWNYFLRNRGYIFFYDDYVGFACIKKDNPKEKVNINVPLVDISAFSNHCDLEALLK